MKFLFDNDVPDEMAYPLVALGHAVIRLREILPVTSPDDRVLRTAAEAGLVLITCNRDDFVEAAARIDHAGVIILIRRRSRAQERAALIRLLDQAGESGIHKNLTIA